LSDIPVMVNALNAKRPERINTYAVLSFETTSKLDFYGATQRGFVFVPMVFLARVYFQKPWMIRTLFSLPPTSMDVSHLDALNLSPSCPEL